MYKLFTHLSVFHKFMTQYVFLLSCVRLVPVYVFLVLNLCISRYRLIKRRSGKKDPLNTCNRMTGGGHVLRLSNIHLTSHGENDGATIRRRRLRTVQSARGFP